MKPMRIFKRILILTAIADISACCQSGNMPSKGLSIVLVNSPEIINKIEFVGTGREKYYTKYYADVTLNPIDTICTYRVFYGNDSDDVTLAYKGTTNNQNADCEEKLDIHYNVKIVSTTFSKAELQTDYDDQKYVQVTP